MQESREDARIPPTPDLLKWHDFAMGEKCKAFGKYCYVAVKRWHGHSIKTWTIFMEL